MTREFFALVRQITEKIAGKSVRSEIENFIKLADEFGLPENDIRNAISFLEHNEFEVSFDIIAQQMYEHKIGIDEHFIKLALKICKMMQIDFADYVFLNELLTRSKSNFQQRKEYVFLGALIGESLDEVIFVEDYLQLRFGGNTITFLFFPNMILGERLFKHGTPDYSDSLTGLLGKTVAAVESRSDAVKEVKITFGDGAIIELSIKDDEMVYPEILIHDAADGSIAVFN